MEKVGRRRKVEEDHDAHTPGDDNMPVREAVKAASTPNLPHIENLEDNMTCEDTTPSTRMGHIGHKKRSRETLSTDDLSPNSRSKHKKLIPISSSETRSRMTNIEDEAFYHGFMSHSECSSFLKSSGDFLVRRTEVGATRPYVISVCTPKGIVKHFVIKRTNKSKMYYVYEYGFTTVPDLIDYHLHHRKPLNSSGLRIERPVSKASYQLSREQIWKTRKLSDSPFGEVYEGRLTLGVFHNRVPVAIKQVRHGTEINMDERLQLIREATFMLKLSHINLLKLYGVATADDPVMIVMELASSGPLINKLKGKHPPNDDEKMTYISGIACGMAYLESKGVVHRDLQARNVLIGKEGEPKLSNFGLSLTRLKRKVVSFEDLPIRWTAPEVFRGGDCTSKSDVWSFGATIYEVITNGKLPYSDEPPNKDIRSGVLDQTMKLKLPEGSSKELMEIMSRCMKFSARERPAFADIDKPLLHLRRSSKPASIGKKIHQLFE